MKGVEYLISNKLVENTPASVAQFFKNTPNLDKVVTLLLYCNLIFYLHIQVWSGIYNCWLLSGYNW